MSDNGMGKVIARIGNGETKYFGIGDLEISVKRVDDAFDVDVNGDYVATFDWIGDTASYVNALIGGYDVR